MPVKKAAFVPLLIGVFWEFSLILCFRRGFTLSRCCSLLSWLKENGKKIACRSTGWSMVDQKNQTNHTTRIKKLCSSDCLPCMINRLTLKTAASSKPFQNDWRTCLVGPYSQWTAIWQNSRTVWNEKCPWNNTAEELAEIKSDILISGGSTVEGDNETTHL